MMKYTMPGKVLIKQVPNKEVSTKEEIFSVDEVVSKDPVEGHIVRCSADGYGPVELNIGDEVLYFPYTGFPLIIDEETYHMLSQNDILLYEPKMIKDA